MAIETEPTAETSQEPTYPDLHAVHEAVAAEKQKRATYIQPSEILAIDRELSLPHPTAAI